MTINPTPKTFRSNLQKRQFVVGALSLLLTAEIVCALFTSPCLRINKVVLNGLSTLPPPELAQTQQCARQLLHCNWILAPTNSVRKALHNLPWVRSVRITRRFPHAAYLQISLRQPFCRLIVGGARYEMDDDAVPIRPDRGLFPYLPTLTLPPENIVCGKPLTDPEIGVILTLLKQCQKQHYAEIAGVEVDSARNICLNMTDGMRVLFGQAEDIAQKITLLDRIYQLQPNVAQLLSIVNLTCPSHPAGVPRLAFTQPSAPPKALSTLHAIPMTPRNGRSNQQG